MTTLQEIKKQRNLTRENGRLIFLRSVTDHAITWKETSVLIRRLRWKPVIADVRGRPILLANQWGKLVRIASCTSLREMTPAQFWERLRKLAPYRVAEVERNIF